MSSTIDDLADALARDTIALMDKLDDPSLSEKVGRILATTSSTTQEAYLTFMKVRLAERRARAFLTDTAAGKKVAVPAAQSDAH